MPRENLVNSIGLSLSARRAWIEIKTRSQPSRPRRVALRKESVDRNGKIDTRRSIKMVALRKESVDRNMREDVSYSIIVKSLSARRAWIEMTSDRL